MFMEAYRKAINVITKKPFTLWGLSLMAGLLAGLAGVLTAPIMALGLAVGYILTAGMAKIYLDGLDEKPVNSDQLFVGFKSFWRVAGGMAWRSLWVFIWFLIPIAGPIFAIYKSYQYRFVPYILMEQPEVSATEALRLSMKKTNGKKGEMFKADILFIIGICVVLLLLMLFSRIKYIGFLFLLVYFVAVVLLICFGGLFKGLYQAYFYKTPDIVMAPAPSYSAPVQPEEQAPANDQPEEN